MKKLLFVLLLGVSLIGKSAPTWNIYDALLNSQTFIEQVEITAKTYANQVLIDLPNPSTAEEIRRYNWCHDVISAKTNSVVIYRIASFVCNDTYLPNTYNNQQIYEDLLNSYSQSPNGVTIFDIIGKVNLP